MKSKRIVGAAVSVVLVAELLGCSLQGKQIEKQLIELTLKENTTNIERIVKDAYLLVGGTINKSGEVELYPWWPIEEEEVSLGDKEDALSNRLDGKNYSIEFLDADGKVLSTTPFANYEDGDIAFSFVVFYPAGTSKVIVKDDDRVLKEIVKTKYAPVVTRAFIEKNEDRYDLIWEIEDPDSKIVHSSLAYSEGRDETLFPIIINTKKRSVLLPKDLPDGEYSIDILVTDGLNEGIYTGKFGIKNSDVVNFRDRI